ncbi:Phasin [Paracoccus benzoatiresistens]|uniref:Phasin n=1 Tax=Paracoccus benzoatiresistens TaxID=2997341 RepID=A0ABT4JAU7_9RHOB|nr:Phasin [Paracoccus sp. EF6]MCZ0964251.1 Phasin [Paracoccus sp. EF6]
MTMIPDFTKTMQDVMASFPSDMSSIQDALRSQSLLGEKLARVALAAAERSTEISARWAKDSITRMGELAAVRQEPSDYAKAVSDFASRSAELAAEHMAAYAEIAKTVQTDTVNLMLTAGKDIVLDAQKAA